ncbi:MAG: two-component regulator propeller domain-containing protein, partial [Bacteroidota bacterium]
MIRQLLLSFLFLAFASNGVVAQNYDTYWNYDISDGLPTNSIYHLFIDSKGKIWFGSDLGVTCYDGQYFKTYTTDDGLEDNTVLRCFEDRSGRIWFHHNNRLPSYYINGEINTVKNPDKDIVISSGSQFVQKKNGNIYLSATNGLLIIHEDLTTSIIYDKSQDPASIVGLINDTLFLSTTEFGPKNLNSINYCIGCMENFLSYRDLSHTMLRSPEYFIENFLKHNRKLKLDPLISKVTNGQTYFIRKYKNKTYLTTINGIYIFSEKNDKLFLEKNILTNLKIVSIDFDQAGNMWASSLGNGLYFFP